MLGWSSISQLPPSHNVFARRVKHALDVPVDRSHDTDAREQRGPPCSATSNSASIAGCHSSASCSAMGQFGDVRGGVTERDQRFPARHRDRIDKPLILRHELHLPLIGGATRNMAASILVKF
jgi:hypothetical protein